MFMKKRALWRGLTTLFTFIFSLTIIIGVVAESYKATIDTALGTLSEKFVSENTEDDPYMISFSRRRRFSMKTEPAIPTR